MSCRKAGRIEEAINTYESCLLVCDDDEGIFFNLARAYMEGGEAEQAIETINRALAINPDFREGQSLPQMITPARPPQRRRSIDDILREIIPDLPAQFASTDLSFL